MPREFNITLSDIRKLIRKVPKSQRQKAIAGLSERTIQELYEDYIDGLCGDLEQDLIPQFKEWGYIHD